MCWTGENNIQFEANNDHGDHQRSSTWPSSTTMVIRLIQLIKINKNHRTQKPSWMWKHFISELQRPVIGKMAQPAFSLPLTFSLTWTNLAVKCAQSTSSSKTGYGRWLYLEQKLGIFLKRFAIFFILLTIKLTWPNANEHVLPWK